MTVPNAARHLLSPQSPDVAISSFNSFHSIQNPNQTPKLDTNPDARKPVAHYPPEAIQAQQHANNGSSGFASMGSLTHTSNSDSGEELFAKALSPRSPDLPRSPFSFSPETLQMWFLHLFFLSYIYHSWHSFILFFFFFTPGTVIHLRPVHAQWFPPRCIDTIQYVYSTESKNW